MQNKKFLKDLSGSAIQIIVTQIANILIFYLISKYISKEEFGFYNWSTATISTIITTLSLGMDLVYVRRVAAGVRIYRTISIHFFHTLTVNLLLIVVVVMLMFTFPDLLEFNTLFLLILINQSVFSLGNSIKFSLNGFEKYNLLAKIGVITGITRIASIVTLVLLGQFTMIATLFVFIANYILEFFVSYYYARRTLSYFIRPKLFTKEYKKLIAESLPQLGTVLFDSAIARIDWILMGIIATSVKTAEYAFAFKMFEISKMPYLIIAPILLTRFSKLFKNDNRLKTEEKHHIDNLFRLEVFIAILIPVVAVAIWTDFFDLITNNKYGGVNQITYLILAVCIPLHYSTNFLWTLAFAQNQLKVIFIITVITSSLNVILNLVLIPVLNSEGAALSFLISTICQVILYIFYTKQTNYRFRLRILLVGISMGAISVMSFYWVDLHWIIKGILSLLLYISLMFSIKFISSKSIKSAFI